MSIVLDGVGYRYPSALAPAVSDVSLQVEPGEVVLLTGPTGCGKSTLLRLAAGVLQRHGQGEATGAVRVADCSPATAPPALRVRHLGFVGQEPDDQLVAGTVGDELAFGMESAGMPGSTIDQALPDLLARVGLDVDPERRTGTLSGGQTQRLVTAAALAAGAPALLLDEPFALLDPAGARSLAAGLRDLADGGRAVLVVEHRLEVCWPHVDRVVVLDDGRVAGQAATAEVGPGHPLLATLRRLGITVPGLLDLADRVAPRDLEAVAFRPVEHQVPPTPGRLLVTARALTHRYVRVKQPALAGVDLEVRTGERVALIGANGAGKSTLLGALAGRIPGTERRGRVVAVPQDPDLSLFCATVREELAHGPTEQRLSPAEVDLRVATVAGDLSVEDLLDRPPQALSRGQRLRVATAAALACRPDVLLLDEPTSGQDQAQVERMMTAAAAAMADGALVWATHDLDLALRHATRVVVLEQGRVLADGAPAEIIRSLPAALPLPDLVRFCLDRGLPPLTPADLEARS